MQFSRQPRVKPRAYLIFFCLYKGEFFTNTVIGLNIKYDSLTGFRFARNGNFWNLYRKVLQSWPNDLSSRLEKTLVFHSFHENLIYISHFKNILINLITETIKNSFRIILQIYFNKYVFCYIFNTNITIALKIKANIGNW